MSSPSRGRRLDHGHDLYLSYPNAFVGCDQQASTCIWTRMYELNYLLPLLYKTWFVITMTLMCCNLSVNYLWNVVTCDVLCWITMILVVCKLVWNPSWFQLTTGFIWAQVREFDHFGDHFCTCALINWSVLLQLVSELDSTLNMSYGYLKTKAFVQKLFSNL